jgi:hypothetical protein
MQSYASKAISFWFMWQLRSSSIQHTSRILLSMHMCGAKASSVQFFSAFQEVLINMQIICEKRAELSALISSTKYWKGIFF